MHRMLKLGDPAAAAVVEAIDGPKKAAGAKRSQRAAINRLIRQIEKVRTAPDYTAGDLRDALGWVQDSRREISNAMQGRG